jgi:hypothetical protein
MREGRLDSAKARKLCVQPAGLILKYFGVSYSERGRRRRKARRVNSFKEDGRLFAPRLHNLPPRLQKIPRILFERCHNVSAGVGAIGILWCSDLLIVNKSLLARKVGGTLNRKRKQNASLYFAKIPARISMLLYRDDILYIVAILSVPLRCSFETWIKLLGHIEKRQISRSYIFSNYI